MPLRNMSKDAHRRVIQIGGTVEQLIIDQLIAKGPSKESFDDSDVLSTLSEILVNPQSLVARLRNMDRTNSDSRRAA